MLFTVYLISNKISIIQRTSYWGYGYIFHFMLLANKSLFLQDTLSSYSWGSTHNWLHDIPWSVSGRVQLCYWVIPPCLKPNSMKHFCHLQHLPAHLNFKSDLKDNKIIQNQVLFTKGWMHWFIKDGSHQSIPCLWSCLGKHLKMFLLELSSTWLLNMNDTTSRNI